MQLTDPDSSDNKFFNAHLCIALFSPVECGGVGSSPGPFGSVLLCTRGN